MSSRPQRGERRADALSKERIVTAAVEILDGEGETALTFRALAARLSTGSGAIYWHVADKHELLSTATDDVVARALAGVAEDRAPREAVRAIALALYDAIEAHPWIGAQLSQEPWESATLRIFEGFGGQLQPLGVPDRAQFDAASALLNYVLGLAGQHAAAARLAARGYPDRATFLADVAARWTDRDPARFPFAHKVAPHLREHDDRAQYLAGIDLVLAGIAATAQG